MNVCITGASSGFGAAIARRFARDGDRVIITGRRAERLEALARDLGPNCRALSFDVRDRQAVGRALKTLPEDFAAVDILVNNAGLSLGLEPAYQANLDEWDAMVDTNITGVLSCTHQLLPGMVERGRGHIINMGSVAAQFPYPGGNVYGATKAFIYQLSLNLRADLVGTGVRVSVIEPGLVGGTEFSNVRFRGDNTRAAGIYADTTPLNADDVADAVHWVATRPPHVNILSVQMMPESQAFGPLVVKRKPQA
ncbi:MAG TPA: SDR family NAD(P)-dependent oxidoreductase [Candidatus Baltobacteraceae bacterium]|jgi:3-hydroxy acid dehydrogenase/malonic semialdehyde reductase|nr:SDR family NAD(P)-dependent oxidoreductase [Candidatus Baltobacteraceae bacterium]